MPTNHSRNGFFLRSIVALLLVTASAKLVSATSSAHLADYPDPLLGLSNRHTLLVVATVEAGVIAALLSRIPTSLKYLSSAWLGGSFLLYRCALSILNPAIPCKCLGNLTERLHIDSRLAGWILTGVAVYLLFGGIYLFLRSQSPKNSSSEPRSTIAPGL